MSSNIFDQAVQAAHKEALTRIPDIHVGAVVMETLHKFERERPDCEEEIFKSQYWNYITMGTCLRILRTIVVRLMEKCDA